MSDDDETVEQPSDEPEQQNVADPKRIARARLSAKRRQEEAREWWRQALSTDIGRRELYGVLANGHAFDERFAAGPNGFPQPEATWCNAGEQRLAFRLYLSWLRLAPEGVALMMSEHHAALAAPPKQKPR